MYKIKMKFLSTEPKTQKLCNKKGNDTESLRRVLLTTQVKVTILNICRSVQDQVFILDLR